MKYFSNDGLNLLLFIGIGGCAFGALSSVSIGPILYVVTGGGAPGWAAFWKFFEICVYFGMGIGFLIGLVRLLLSILISKR